MGQKGHATDTCWKLKNEIQDLIDAGIIQIKENGLGRDEIIVNMMGSMDLKKESSTIEAQKTTKKKGIVIKV